MTVDANVISSVATRRTDTDETRHLCALNPGFFIAFHSGQAAASSGATTKFVRGHVCIYVQTRSFEDT